MKYMIKEMQGQLFDDISKGKIWGLKLIQTDSEVIKSNKYADIFNASCPLCGFDREKFYIKTHLNSRKDVVLEAYYAAFNYYDGEKLQSQVEIPNAVDQKDCIDTITYQVLFNY